MNFPRLRISLRLMFVLTTLVAIACYTLVLPTVNAERFIRAIETGDYPAADALFIDTSDAFLAAWHEESSEFRATAKLLPWSIRQIIAGERTLSLNVGMIEVNGPSRGRMIRIIAHRTGLGKPQLYGFSGGGGGIAAHAGTDQGARSMEPGLLHPAPCSLLCASTYETQMRRSPQ